MSLKDLSVGEISEKLEILFELIENQDWEDEDRIEGPTSWDAVKYNEDLPVTITDLGTLKYVDDYGGEGQGDEYWVVFSLTEGDVTRTFRKDGWYQSHNGGELDAYLIEVTPVQKMVTAWEEI